MGRTSTIDRLPPEVHKHLMRRLRERGLTLDELIEDLRTTFPQLAQKDDEGKDKLPSRSGVHRFRQGINAIVAQEREIAVAAEALVAELGDGFDSKSGALLAQAVTTLANKRTFQALEATNEGKVLEISDVLDLARTAKTVNEARGLSLKERRAVAEDARRKLLEEQQAKLDAVSTKNGLSADTVEMLRREILGIAA